MTTWRWAFLAGLLAAAIVDLCAYLTFGTLRSVITRQHWIFYLYLAVPALIIVGSLVVVAGQAVRRLRRG